MTTADATSRTLFTLITSPRLPEDFSDSLDAAILRERGADPDRFPTTRPDDEITTVSGMTAEQEHAFELYLSRATVRRRRTCPEGRAA